MGFKSGLLIGLGVGYVLGTKAGRERYEELKASWDQFMGKPAVQSVVTRGREVAEAGTQAGIRAVDKAADKAAGTVKERLGEDDAPKTGRSSAKPKKAASP